MEEELPSVGILIGPKGRGSNMMALGKACADALDASGSEAVTTHLNLPVWIAPRHAQVNNCPKPVRITQG